MPLRKPGILALPARSFAAGAEAVPAGNIPGALASHEVIGHLTFVVGQPVHPGGEVEAALPRQGPERLPGDVLHDDEVAALGFGHLLQRREMGAHFLGRQRRGGDGADRMPAIAMPRRAAERSARMAADPDRRMRLL